MRNNSRLWAALALAAATGMLGYAFGAHRYGPSEPPGRMRQGAVVPAGIGADLHAALMHPDLPERATRVATLLAPLGPDALDSVRAAYEGAVLDTGDVELVLLGDWWASFDPEAALAWARESGIGWHPATITAVVRAWARHDPEAASRGLAGLTLDERLRTAALLGLVRGWEESGFPGLEAFLEGWAGGDEASIRAIDALARGKVARGGPEAGIAWAEGLPDRNDGSPSDFKLNAYRRVASAIVAVDPDRAAAWVAGLRGGEYASGLLFRTATSWAELDGEAAMRWLSTLPPDRDLPLAVQEGYRMWISRDKEAAFAWIRSTDPEPWLDPALQTYAMALVRTQPEEAIAWAQRVSDPQRREMAIVRAVAGWMIASPEPAQEWLDRSDLPEPVREKIASVRDRQLERNARAAARQKMLSGRQSGGAKRLDAATE